MSTFQFLSSKKTIKTNNNTRKKTLSFYRLMFFPLSALYIFRFLRSATKFLEINNENPCFFPNSSKSKVFFEEMSQGKSILSRIKSEAKIRKSSLDRSDSYPNAYRFAGLLSMERHTQCLYRFFLNLAGK